MRVLLALAAVTVVGAAAAVVLVRRAKLVDVGAPTVPAVALDRELRLHEKLTAVAQRRLHPGAVTGLLMTVTVATIIVAVAAVGILVLSIRSGIGLAVADVPFARWAADNATKSSSDWLGHISRLGGTDGVVVPAVLLAGYELVRRRDVSVLAFLTVTVGGQFAVSNAIKWAVDRARPDLLQLSGFAGTSFPSGHATAAAASYAAFALVLSRRRPRRTAAWLAGGAAGIAVAVAATRVLLGVHWTTDVVAGLLVGWAWFGLASVAFGGRLLQFGAPVTVAERLAESRPPVATTN